MTPFIVRVALSLVCVGAVAAQEPERPSSLEMRFLARSDYEADGIRFDLEEEQRRVRAWLSDQGRRQAIVRNPHRIHLFNWCPADQGGPKSSALAWYPSVILPSRRAPGRWDYSFSQNGRGSAVALFSAQEFAAGPTEERRRLLELLPINLHEPSFSNADLSLEGTGIGPDPKDGVSGLFYTLRADRRAAFADWSEAHRGQTCAYIFDGLVRTAPTFHGRIVGTGILTGISEAEMLRLIATVAAARPPVDSRTQAADALIEANPLDRSVAPAYAYRLAHDRNEDRRLRAAKALASFGPVPQAVPLLIRAAANETNVRVLREIVTTLGVAGRSDPAVVEALARLARHGDAKVAARASALLGGKGK